MSITEVCIRRPVFAWMIMGATVLFGIVAGREIGVSQYPDVDFPTITVSATWEGASPDVMESEVIEELEEAMMQVEGVRSITSTARTVGFELLEDLDHEGQEARYFASRTDGLRPMEFAHFAHARL